MDEHNALVDERERLLDQCQAFVNDREKIPALLRGQTADLLFPRLYEMYMAHFGAETWFTTCTGCAATLDRSYAETVRAEKAENEAEFCGRSLRDAAEHVQRLEQRVVAADALADAVGQPLVSDRPEEFWEPIRSTRTAYQALRYGGGADG